MEKVLKLRQIKLLLSDIMTGKKIRTSISTTKERMEKIDQVSSNRSEFINEAIDQYLKTKSGIQMQIKEMEEKINETRSEIKTLNRKKDRLEHRKKQLEKEIKSKKQEEEKYNELVDKLVDLYEQGLPVKQQDMFSKAIRLSDEKDSIAEKELISEIKERSILEEEPEDSGTDFDLGDIRD